MVQRTMKIAALLGALATYSQASIGQVEKVPSRSSQQKANYMSRWMECDALVGTSHAPERPDATAGMVSDDFIAVAKPAFESVDILRQYPRADEKFYDLADKTNEKLIGLPQSVHYLPDAVVCGFISDIYGYIVEDRVSLDRDAAVKKARSERIEICSTSLRNILDTKNLLGSTPRFVYAPCGDATRKVTAALKAEQVKNQTKLTH